jgi:hypothetical protein
MQSLTSPTASLALEMSSVGSTSPVTPRVSHPPLLLPPPPSLLPEAAVVEKKSSKKKRPLEVLAISAKETEGLSLRSPSLISASAAATQTNFERGVYYQGEWLENRFYTDAGTLEYRQESIKPSFSSSFSSSLSSASASTSTTTSPSVHTTKPMMKIMRKHAYRLPEWLTKDAWTRHRLSLDDINLLLHECPENRWLWILNMIYGLSTPLHHSLKNKLIYPQSNHTRKLLIQSLRQYFQHWPDAPSKIGNPAFRLLQSQLQTPSSSPILPRTKRAKMASSSSSHTSGHTIATTMSQVFTDPYPIHYVSNKVFEPLAIDLEKQAWEWKNIYVVALEYGQSSFFKHLLMGRILPWNVYTQIYGVPTSLLQMPRIVTLGSDKFAVMEERFYFVTDCETM